MKNIAIAGLFGSGKSTISRELQTNYGYVPVSLATNLKMITSSVYGTLNKSEEVDTVNQWGEPVRKTVRTVLQELGQAVKVVDRDLWLKWMLRDNEDLAAEGMKLVIDDLRYPFEAEALRDTFFIVRLQIPNDVRMDRYFSAHGRYPTEQELSHSSETELQYVDADLLLTHDGQTSPEVLAEQILAAMGVPA